MLGQLLHVRRVGPARVQHGPAVSIDRAGVLTVEGDDIARPAVGVLDIEVRERFPTAAQTADLDVVVACAIRYALDDRIETGNVAAAGENADAHFRHAIS